MRATKVTAGLAESNGKLLLGIWRDSLHVTCGLTACTPGSAPGPTLGNEYGKLYLYLVYAEVCGRCEPVVVDAVAVVDAGLSPAAACSADLITSDPPAVATPLSRVECWRCSDVAAAAVCCGPCCGVFHNTLHSSASGTRRQSSVYQPTTAVSKDGIEC